MSKQDKKIVNAQSKMDKELTGDKAVDSVITTPQSQWSPYQIAVANLNPDLKSRNKRYQSALNSRNVLENEKVNLGQAGELMMNAYRDAIQHTEDAANQMMAANSAQAAIQAGGAISGSAGLSTNPAAAAATRIAAQNNATAQNMQIRSNADQNIANLYGNAAQVPSTLASISANNAQMEANAQQAIANANLANAQAAYYGRMGASSGGSTRSSSSSNGGSTTNKSGIDLSNYFVQELEDGKFQVTDKDGNVINDPEIVDAVKKYVDETAASTDK